ncbi:MAG: hypothetical protein ABIJ12_07195, partial [bacterium]
MEKTIITLIFIILLPCFSFADVDYSIDDVKVILYKSGEITRGIIVDSIPGQSITVMSGRGGYTFVIDYIDIYTITDDAGYLEAAEEREKSEFGSHSRYAHPFVGSLMIRRISNEDNFTYTTSLYLGFSVKKFGWLGLSYGFLLDDGDGFS